MRTVRFTTTVAEVPPSPLGLLPAKIVVDHCCSECRQLVPTDQLVDHARAHAVSEEHAAARSVSAGWLPTEGGE